MALTRFPDAKERVALWQECRKQMRRMDWKQLVGSLKMTGKKPAAKN